MQNISHRGILRYHAGALWLETLRTGNEKGIKKPTLMEEGGLTPRELDDIAADVAAANNLLKDRYESIHFFYSMRPTIFIVLQHYNMYISLKLNFCEGLLKLLWLKA